MTYVSGEEAAPAGCFICAAAAGAGGAAARYVVELTELTVVLLNRYPYSPGHLMVAPRRHLADLTELNAGEGEAVFAAAQRAVAALREAMTPGGFNVGLNLGSAAGASVDHLHLHVVPRWGGDTNFMPVIADVKVLPEHLDATASRLRGMYTTPAPPEAQAFGAVPPEEAL
jgi:ATP adenylyltransferase